MKCERCGRTKNLKYLEEFEHYFCEDCITYINEPEIDSFEYCLDFESDSPYTPGDYPIPKHIMDQLPKSNDFLFDGYGVFVREHFTEGLYE